MANPSEIMNLLSSDSLRFTYRNGNTGSIENMFEFSEPEIIQDEQETQPGI
jgi:hypothetical protein